MKKPIRTPLQDAIAASRPALVTAVVFSFFVNLLVFVGPLYMMQVYDRVLTSRNETTLIMLTIIAGAMLVAYALLEMFRSRVLVRGGVRFDEMAAEPTFNAVLRAHLLQPGHGHHQTLRDIDTVREFYTGQGLLAFCDLPWVPLFVAVCFLLHPWFGYLAILGAVLIFALTLAGEMTTRPELGEASKQSLAANAFATASFRNAEVLHALGMLSSLRARWSEKHGAVLAWQALASDRAGVLLAITKFTRMFLQSLALGVGAYLAIQNQISPGAMIAATILISRALAPIEMVVAQWKSFVSARTSFARLQGMFRSAPAGGERVRLDDPEGALRLDSVYAVPPGGQKPVLANVSFAINAGEALAVVGPSAAGKSSLARVLVGVWQPANGAVRLDGADLRHWDAEDLGRYLGYLPQDVELFSGSVAENIARFRETDDEAVIAAAKLAGVHDMIQGFADGYNTQIGEGGLALSGGQRQRIGLARALFGDPRLIVLDEPNASLDQDGEAALLSAVQALRQRGRTVVLITHKANILASVDKILMLNQGQVALFGPRDEVLQRLVGPRVVSVAGQAPQPAVSAAS